jgi:RNA polymerase sigma-70 factor (ECF subfamily)
MEASKQQALTDDEVIARIVANNNLEWFSVLYDRYCDVVFAKCLSFTKNRAEAEDLAHDIFIKVFTQLKKFDGKSKFSTWLYSLSYHHCVNHVNRVVKKRPATIELDNYESEDEPDDKVLLEMQIGKLEKALQSIPVEDKMILLMKYHDDLSIKDIGLALEIGDSAVKMRLKRAKSKCLAAYNSVSNEPQTPLAK